MANRTGTYFAFDGLGQTDPTKSDFRYYAIAQGWDASKAVEFKFVNSHDKASAVQDSSKMATLKASIHQRLAASKNMVVIISPDTRKSGSLLSWEIEQAVDRYKLPLIVAYTNYNYVLSPASHKEEWPIALATRIADGSAQAIQIPFRRDAVFDSIGQFTVNSDPIGSALSYYNRVAQVKWGYL